MKRVLVALGPGFVVYAASLAFFAAVALVTLRATGGVYVYPLDDAYIHLAIAKTLGAHGVYGIGPEQVATAASSIMWPLMLRALAALGIPLEWTALVSSMAASAGVVVLVWRMGLSSFDRPWISVGVAAFLGLTIPLAPLALSGMEHAFHALLTLAVIFRASDALARRKPRPPDEILCALLIGLAMLTRYESAGLGLSVAALAAFRRRGRFAALSVLAVLVPVVGFALWADGHGLPALPGSVLLKLNRGALGRGEGAVGVAIERATLLARHPHMAAALAATALAFGVAHRAKLDARMRAMAALGLLVVLGHVVAGSYGWLFRYEAYAMAAGFTVSLIVLMPAALGRGATVRPVAAWGLAALCLAQPFGRGLLAMRTTVTASQNVHDQQFQIARLVRSLGPKASVAVNDVGAVAFFTDARVTDLMGLGDPEVASMKHWSIEGGLDRQALGGLLARRSVGWLIVYDEWFEFASSSEWPDLAIIEIPDNRICAFARVAIRARSNTERGAGAERRAVERWARELPARVAYQMTRNQSSSSPRAPTARAGEPNRIAPEP